MAETRDAYRRFHAGRHRMLRDLMAAHVPRRTERLLDVGGAGDIGGSVDFILKDIAGEVHALDQGGDVDEGRRKGIVARACDIDNEPFPHGDASFEVVVFASVLEHLYNPAHVAREIARVLAPGGLLFLETPNAVALGRRLDALAGRNPFHQFNEYNAAGDKAPMVRCAVFYTPAEAEALLGDRFETVEVRHAMHDPPQGRVKRALRAAAFRVAPSLGDCFCLVARRKG